jgi:hypothetical protein
MLLAFIVVGYTCFAGYLAYNFAQGVREDCVVPMTKVVLNLSEANKGLNVKIEFARSVVRRIETENVQLKNSVRVGAEMLQAQIEDNDKLHQQIEGLQWRIDTLEDLVKPTP